MKANIEVTTGELVQLHNALLFVGGKRLNAIGFGEIVKVEISLRDPKDLFVLGRCIGTMPSDRKVDDTSQVEETTTKKVKE